MAKFCTKCGKELKEGMACDCQNKTVAPASNNIDVNAYVNSYIEMVKGILAKPVDTIKKFVKADNFILGLIAILLNCIVSGIFLYCLCKEAIGLVGGLVGGFDSLLVGSSIDVPFVKTVLYGVLFMAAGFATTAAMIYLIANIILKDKVNIKESFVLVGVCSVFTTVTTLIAILLTYISMKIMFIVLLLAGIFYLTYLYQGIVEITKVEKNKLAYVFVPTIAVATFVVVYILPKILM